jgi:hypothetical protein
VLEEWMRQIYRAALISGGLILAAGASHAKPEFAKKEMKMCGYCHVNPAGGGPRNPKGVYYAMHDKSFKGLAPEYKSLWKMEVATPAERIALGDVTGDKTARLVLLGADGKATVNKVADNKLTEEASIDLGKDAKKFVVGAYAKDKPAVIVIPGAVFYKDGDKYSRKEAKDITDVTGHARFTDGAESVFFFAGGGMPDAWGIDLAGDKTVIAGHEFVDPGQGGGVYADITIHPPIDLLANLGVPEEAQKIAVMGLFDPRNEGKLYQWLTWVPKEGGHFITVGEFGGGPGDFKPIWKSPKLSGKILDVAVGNDPRGSKNTGILVLTQAEDGEKKRSIEFFALD